LIAQYRLSKASVTHAIQLGLTAEGIQQSLERASGSSVPQNVKYSLLEWERQARRVEVWRGATLIEVDDPALLDALAAQSSSWILRRLAPTMAEVSSRALAQLEEWLWQRDYLPALTSAVHYQDLTLVPAVGEAQWQLQLDGLLKPLYAVPDLYLASTLERFTTRSEATGWQQLTHASLQQALAVGLELEHMLAFLQRYCAGGVPGSFLIRMKLWGDGYSEPPAPGVEHTPLLRISAQALDDLLADEEMAPLLAEPLPADQRVVRVSPENLERVVELLRARGFDVSG
jgi:hypothetical protein